MQFLNKSLTKNNYKNVKFIKWKLFFCKFSYLYGNVNV